MATQTTHYNLTKPDLTDPVDVTVLNGNADIIDQKIYEASQSGGSATAMIENSVEASATSAHAYAAGEHFIYNNTLYRATAAIAIGDTITPGTNCEATTAAAELEGKVNKVTGKQLSTEDYTTAEKTKLSGIEAQANKTVIDSTLTQTGQAADAKATGDAVSELRNTLNHKASIIYDTASGDIASFPDGADGLPVKDLTVGIEPVQSGTGDPSPTNVRPISGWTGCNVTRTGKNLYVAVLNPFTSDNNSRYVNTNGIFIKKGTYKLSFNLSSPGSDNRIYPFMSDSVSCAQSGNLPSVYRDLATIYVIEGANSSTFEATADGYFYIFASGTAGKVFSNVQFELGSTSSAYEPYLGTTLPISWQSSAGTVYGGTLDVTSGVLTVDRAMFASTWGDGGTPIDRGNNITSKKYALPNVAKNKNATAAGDTTNVTSTQIFNTTGNVHFFIGEDNSAVVFLPQETSASQEIQILYELATPQTYQLTPQEVITTLLGWNNIWSDTGSSTVEYPCDTKLYIDKKLAALVAALS